MPPLNPAQPGFSLRFTGAACRRKDMRRSSAGGVSCAPVRGDGNGAVRIPRRWQSRTLLRALLLFLSGLASGADPFESPGDETIAISTPILPEQIDVPSRPQTPAPPWSGDFWKRSQLTGDWFGSRDKLAENGSPSSVTSPSITRG